MAAPRELTGRAVRAVGAVLARRGVDVRRHPAARRQRLLARHGVDVVLDVGAARGGYGRQLRDHGYRGRIISFEPMRAAYERLVAEIGDDPAWSARHTALGAEAGTATIHVASNSDSSSFLPMLDDHLEASPETTYVGEEEVAVAQLDDLADDLLPAGCTPFLKIDTQGFERAVLEGAGHTLARCAGLQLELSFVPLYEGGMLVDEAVSWAYGQGFVLAGFEQGFAAPTGETLQVDGVFVRSPGAR